MKYIATCSEPQAAVKTMRKLPASASAQDHAFSYLRYPACQSTLSSFLQLHQVDPPKTEIGLRGLDEKENRHIFGARKHIARSFQA